MNVGCAGGCNISTVEDLIKWNDYFYNKIASGLRIFILTKYYEDQDGDYTNLDISTSNTVIGYCYGFQGALDSYRNIVGYFSEHNLNIVILSNNTQDFKVLMQALDTTLIK